MPTQAPTSIRARLMRMNLIVVIVSIALSLAGTLYFTLRSEQRALDNNLLNSASILSRVPMLREALQGTCTVQELADYLEVDRRGLSMRISRLKKEGMLECDKNFFRLSEKASEGT